MKQVLELTNIQQFKHNSGLALPIILVLLLAMTILGVTSLSSSTLQERMTASQRLREIAFNAAETTLRVGEAQAESIRDDIRRGILTTQSGTQFRLFAINDSADPLWVLGIPSSTDPNPGDSCQGGYCTPMEFDKSGTANLVERWLDPAVWNDPERHRVIESAEQLDAFERQGIANAPQYIIEFLGELPARTDENDPNSTVTPCATSSGPSSPPEGTPADPPFNKYPYCEGDPAFFRITARAVAGLGGRESAVILQSTIVVP